jgi:hypothetical protein
MKISKTCFIENDTIMDEGDMDSIVNSIWRSNGKEDMEFDKLFDVVVLDASNNIKDVLERHKKE